MCLPTKTEKIPKSHWSLDIVAHRIPRRDALHAILARDNGAVLVATDRHFEQIRHICESRRPEEI